MECKRYENKIALYAGNDLPPAQAAALERHLESCAACRSVLEATRKTVNVVRALRDTDTESLQAPLRARVVTAIQQTNNYSPWTKRAALAVAFGIVAMASGTIIYRTSSNVSRIPVEIAAKPPAPRAAVPVVASPASHAVPASVVKLYCNDPNVVIYLVPDNPRGDFHVDS